MSTRFVYIIVILFFILVTIEVSTKRNASTTDELTMYYTDSLDIGEIKEKLRTNILSVESVSDYLITDGQEIKLKKSDSLLAYNLLQHCIVHTNRGSVNVPIHIKFWKDDIYYLEEINPQLDGVISRNFRHYFNRVRELLNIPSYNRLLLTQNDTSYYAKNGRLYWKTIEDEGMLCKFQLKDRIYNQLIKCNHIAFLRSGSYIFASTDNMHSWKEIYKGKRAIKESMYYNQKKTCLIFTQYTPGKIRERHYVLSYSLSEEKLDTVLTFKTLKECKDSSYCCRHIHILALDPYSGDLYMGTGDADKESGIYRSQDGGEIFRQLFNGSQDYRTLTFLFTRTHILWGTDSSKPQYLSSISRDSLNTHNTNSITRYPVYNSALWCSNYIKEEDMWVLSSNNEGSLYDNNNHYVLGVKVDENGAPEVYNILCEKSWSNPYHQLFPLGQDIHGRIWFYDTENYRDRVFKLVKKR